MNRAGHDLNYIGCNIGEAGQPRWFTAITSSNRVRSLITSPIEARVGAEREFTYPD
jgi:hypothetical protein